MTQSSQLSRVKIVDQQLNQLGHLVNSIVNYLWYSDQEQNAKRRLIINAVFEMANYTTALVSGHKDLFREPVGAHWVDTLNDADESWVMDTLTECSEIIRSIIARYGLYYHVTADGHSHDRVSLLIVDHFDNFRYIDVIDYFSEGWLSREYHVV